MQNFFELHVRPFLLYLSSHNSVRYILIAAIVFLLAILLIDRKRKEKSTIQRSYQSIAGEDVMATQLDLAKAYTKMGQKDLALTILKNVKRKGNATQQLDAQQLIENL